MRRRLLLNYIFSRLCSERVSLISAPVTFQSSFAINRRCCLFRSMPLLGVGRRGGGNTLGAIWCEGAF